MTVTKRFVTWAIMPCSQLKANLQVPTKYEFNYHVLHGIIFQKTELLSSIELLKMPLSKLITVEI
jgi:hypothetical protein